MKDFFEYSLRGLISRVLITTVLVFTAAVLPAYADNGSLGYDPNHIDSPEPSAVGYRIIPGEYPVKKTLLIKDISFDLITRVDGDRWLIHVYRIPGWSSGKYDEKPKLAFLDMTTGELTYTPYQGRFRCYDGNRIAYYKEWPRQVMMGEYGGKMEPFMENISNDPNGLTLDKNCQIIKRSDIPHKDYGTKKIPGLRASYAFPNDALFTVQSIALEPTYPRTHIAGVPEPIVSKVMQDKWIWRGPNGKTKLIPTNQGEVFGMWEVLPFENKAIILYPQTQAILAPYGVYKHIRILYPDGRLEVFPFPDLIWEAIISGRGQTVGGAYMYTKAGLIWGVGENSIMPSGDYIEDRKNKTLTKVSETGKELGDGCRQLTQKSYKKSFFSKEWFYEYYILDFCTKDNK